MSAPYQNQRDRCHGTTEPLVSVVMPAFNVGRYLRAAVDSILAQSLSSLEIVIVDDGSSDDTLAVARELAARDSRVRVFTFPCNRGQSAARNRGLAESRGKWVALVDADDEITPDRLRILSAAGNAADADFIADGVVFAGPRHPGAPSRLSVCRGLNGETRTLSLEALIKSDIPLNGQCSFGYLKPLMRREFLERWRLRYDEDLRFAEDFNFFVRTLVCGARFVLHPSEQYIYNNDTPVSVSRNVNQLPRHVDHALVNIRRMRELIREFQIGGLDPLLDEHEQRWSTVIWFNRLKLALRSGRISDVLHLSLDCPSGARGVLRFARDRARVKRTHVHMLDS